MIDRREKIELIHDLVGLMISMLPDKEQNAIRMFLEERSALAIRDAKSVTQGAELTRLTARAELAREQLARIGRYDILS